MLRSFLFLLLLVLNTVTMASAASITGRVVGISDGDTFTLLTADKRQVKVRLAEIDAPENGQPFSKRSKQALSRLVYRKIVRVEVQTTDKYGRTVGRPYVDGIDVCATMVRTGAARVYPKYVRDHSLYADEAAARDASAGLWKLPKGQRTPPWIWRRRGNASAAPGGCRIKGNISERGRVYHLPGQRSYGRTRIDERRGERWFCSEDEAIGAGWRGQRG